MKWKVIIILLVIIIAGYAYVSSLSSPYTPMGRLSFVKILNPDMAQEILILNW